MNVYFIGAKNPETKRQIAAQQKADADFVASGFIDNDESRWGTTFLGLPVLGGFGFLPELLRRDPGARFVNLITGSTTTRFETTLEVARLGGKFTNLIHPDVDVADVTLGVGLYVQEVVLQAGAIIRNNASIHVGAVVAHESIVGASAFVAHKVSISGEVSIGDGCFVGTNASIVPRVTIGSWVTVGAGTVVLNDVKAGSTIVGNPGRTIRQAAPTIMSGDPFASTSG